MSSSCAATRSSTASGASRSARTCSSPRRRSSSRPEAGLSCRRSRASSRRSRGGTARRRPPRRAPETLVILGGGVVGVELAQAWTSLGTKVVLLEGAPRVIVREEPFASAEVEAALRDAGVDVRTNCRAVSVARDGDVTVDDGGRFDRHRRRAAGRRGPEAEHREPRARDDRARAGQVGRGRLEPAFFQARLALRDRRRERPCAAHAHGQVSGPARCRLDPRPERDGSSPTARSRRA